jgi:protein-tyrosine phosphatase
MAGSPLMAADAQGVEFMRPLSLALILCAFAVGSASGSTEGFPIPLKDNTHLIDHDARTGFAIYRSSKPNRIADFKRLCALGVTEVMVLDGTGSVDADLARQYCPGLKVIFNEAQVTKTALTVPFLRYFDRWVENARATGKKIAFRCHCGCHRTGRLAAYYQMKYQGFTSEQAIAVMMDLGKFMYLHPTLPSQVYALRDYLQGKDCTQQKDSCVPNPF